MTRRKAVVVAAGIAVLVVGGLAAAVEVRRSLNEEGDTGVSTIISTPREAASNADPEDERDGPRIEVATLTIRDRLSGDPVPDARVQIAGRSLETDPDGIVTMRGLMRRSYRVQVEAPGYAKLDDRIRFRPGARFTTAWVWRPQWSWPAYGADEQRTGSPEGIELRPPLRSVWALPLDSLLELPPVTWNGIGYAATYKGTLTAFRTEDGEWLWRRTLRETVASSPGVADGRVFVVTFAGQVRAFGARSGALLWQRALGTSLESSPFPFGGRLLVGGENGSIWALSASTGRTLWQTRTAGKITAAFARYGNLAIVGDYDGEVRAMRISDGRPVWTTHVGGQLYATPSVSSGRVFVTSSTEKTLSALDAGDGHLIWTQPVGDFAYAAPSVSGPFVVTGGRDGSLSAWRAADGKLLWRHKLAGKVYGSPVIVAGVVWAASFGGQTEARDVRTGRLLQRFPHGRYAGAGGDARTLFLFGYRRIFGMRPPPSVSS